jgi:hypothetical protein
MKTGRNDPCPCGSGKKYKKCCLSKDQEKAVTQPAEVLPPPSTPAQLRPVPAPAERARSSASQEASPLPWESELPPEPPDPETEKWDALWEEFDATDNEGRLGIFQAALEDAESMTDEVAFEMLSRLHDDAAKRGERTRFAEWVGMLRERLPKVYKKSAHYYLSLCLQDALAENRLDVVPSLALKLGAGAGRDLDRVHRALNALAYHGQLSALVEAYRVGWPKVKASSDVLEWAISDFANRGADSEIFNYLEHTTSPDPDDPALLERLKFFVEDPDLDYVRYFISDLTGKSGRAWTADDFALKAPRKRARDNEDDAAQEPEVGSGNLNRLICEFVGYLRYEEGVAFPRGALVRPELFRYFVRRHEGELNPKPSMFDQFQHPNRKLPKPPPPIHPLAPERITLNVHLSGMLNMFNGLYHGAAALFQAMPAWLRFLESRRLIDAETRAKVVEDLLPLHAQVCRLWEEFTEDSTLYRDAQTWPEDAAKALPAPRS